MSLDARLRHPRQPTGAVYGTPAYPAAGKTEPKLFRISGCDSPGLGSTPPMFTKTS